MVTEAEILTALRNRYEKRKRNGNQLWAPRYVTVSHMQDGHSFTRNIADLIAFDCNVTNDNHSPWDEPRLFEPYYAIHGHEVKTSRSDWLRELRTPQKAEAFRRFCSHWWLVAVDGVVKDDLPDGWGLMVYAGGQLRIRRPSAVNTKPDPMPPGMIASALRNAAGLSGNLPYDPRRQQS